VGCPAQPRVLGPAGPSPRPRPCPHPAAPGPCCPCPSWARGGPGAKVPRPADSPSGSPHRAVGASQAPPRRRRKKKRKYQREKVRERVRYAHPWWTGPATRCGMAGAVAVPVKTPPWLPACRRRPGAWTGWTSSPRGPREGRRRRGRRRKGACRWPRFPLWLVFRPSVGGV